MNREFAQGNGDRGPERRPSVGGVLLSLSTVAILLVAVMVQAKLAVGLVVLALIFIPMERLLSAHPQRILRHGWLTDANHFVVNTVLLKIGLFLTVVVAGTALRALVPSAVRLGIATQPAYLQIIEGFAVAELGGYLGHRASHRVPFLWRFHKVHHSIREMDWLAANHLHPIDQVFIRSCAVLPFYALGFSRASLGGYTVLLTFEAILIHSNVRLGARHLRYVIATPHFHHWHHAQDSSAYNSNFAGVFPILDAIFGTYYAPRGTLPARYGIDEVEPGRFLRQLAWPFRAKRDPISSSTR